ncbi:crotonobetainyl-CoA:carnitine CoA-transferase CaiB-like acyl-CoA transferase [Mycobacterium frederiksbergense]|uniref:Crotonobetainyl-CoA:carnitine CoA-transferase CaiB-like acyl-CoA transferase n=1 Tax=Mycolicibacterium frederiksbergense TaxID=117567 RepID=A0ABT6L6A3_9MYCO|nr:CoA transferase [Mycolicibacterium frederiksbergense]MDH6198492.1 crotonobetainyl-CoA:carnitine CoA-transferase CaiB-like acyl-CoA transferase [Mycolicibacterium frederiksbergense]
MITNPFQRKAYDAVSSALPFAIDPAKITVEPGVSYLPSPIKLHDYAAGVMAALGSVVEHLGRVRGLPSQTMTLNRRLAGFHLNELQVQLLNGYSVMLDTWPMGADNGAYRTKDGRYVWTIGLFPHLVNALLGHLQCPNNPQAIQAAVEKYTAQQLEDEVAGGLNLAVGMVRTPQEWLAHPQGAATAALPLFSIDQQGTTKQRVLGNAKYRPLEGVRVVDLTNVVAGPTAGFAMAEQGADVIAVQAPRGDWVTPIWLSVNWGKKTILTDIKSPDGNKRFIDLLAGADVLLSSQRPGALDRLGLGETELREINPNLIYGSESFASLGTPWVGRRGFEQIAQAVTGTADVHSEGLGLQAPTVTPALMNDHLTGYLLAIAVVAALAEREDQGGFWRVDASLSRTSTFGQTLLEPVDDEPYAPITEQDLIEHGVDQVSPWGTFTRFAPPVAFSHTPSMALRATSWPGTDPDTIGWTANPAGDAPPQVPHYPSKLAREGRIRNFTPNFGIEDRADGGGVVGLMSKPEALEAQLKKYATDLSGTSKSSG